MKFIIDNHNSERQYQLILQQIKQRKNGELADSLIRSGLDYNFIWGVSVPELKDIAREYKKDHLLAMKLWNKDWRESRILATYIDDPGYVTEEQMDYWTKSFANIEIAEQTVSNLWVKTPYAFIKALEWCRGRKYFVKYTGLHLMGRLAMFEKKALDEMFEPFFEVIFPLAKDKSLASVFLRNMLLIGNRSPQLKTMVVLFAESLMDNEMDQTKRMGQEILENLQD